MQSGPDIRMALCVYIRMYVCMYACMYMHTYSWCTIVMVGMVDIYMYIYIYAYIHTYTIHKYTYTHIYAYLQLIDCSYGWHGALVNRVPARGEIWKLVKVLCMYVCMCVYIYIYILYLQLGNLGNLASQCDHTYIHTVRVHLRGFWQAYFCART